MTSVAVTITEKEKAELLPAEIQGPIQPDKVRGRTLATLVSPGTELAFNYQGRDFPTVPGYAAVFTAEEIGTEVKGIKLGDRLFVMGNHRSIQCCLAVNATPVPDILAPEEALIARLMAVSMTTLMTTTARPGDIVLVTGAGPVGYLCAHLFKVSGYDVHVADPDPARQGNIKRSGITNVYSSANEYEGIKGKVALVTECSGHEQAVLDGINAVRKKGEVVLVGVPWRKQTDLTAHQILDAVFHNYAVLRSGWEWELRGQVDPFRHHTVQTSIALALKWLAEGRIPTQGLITIHDPKDAQKVYQSLLHQEAEGLFQVFDWQRL